MSRQRRPASPILLTDPLDIAFVQWVRTLPRELLPHLARALRAQAERWPAQKAHAAMLKFLRAAGYPDAERRVDKLMQSGLRVVSNKGAGQGQALDRHRQRCSEKEGFRN